MKSLIDMLNEISFKYNNIKVIFNSSHPVDRLLQRSDISPSQFKTKLKRFINEIDEIDDGIYVFIFKSSKIKVISRFKKDKILIITVLSASMIEKDYDYKITLDEADMLFKEFNISLNENEFTVPQYTNQCFKSGFEIDNINYIALEF